MALPLKHVQGMSASEKRAIVEWANVVRARLGMAER
jgi:hypothetical protein